MTEVIIIPWGRTDWSDQGRLMGITDLPLNDTGRSEIAALSQQLAEAPPQHVQFGPEEAARETVTIIAVALGLKARRPVRDLHEINLGLWQGLTEDEVQQRFTSAHEQWRESPETVCLPEGEPMADAAVRLQQAAERALRRYRDTRVAFVVGPMAAAALRCRLEDHSLIRFWEHYDAREPVHRMTWPHVPAGPMPAPEVPPALIAGRTEESITEPAKEQ